jgi:hypothetical protein
MLQDSFETNNAVARLAYDVSFRDKRHFRQ